MTKNNQPAVPHRLERGDRVKFTVRGDDDDPRYGTIVDVLASQFLIEDDEHVKYITHFRNVMPLVRVALP